MNERGEITSLIQAEKADENAKARDGQQRPQRTTTNGDEDGDTDEGDLRGEAHHRGHHVQTRRGETHHTQVARPTQTATTTTTAIRCECQRGAATLNPKFTCKHYPLYFPSNQLISHMKKALLHIQCPRFVRSSLQNAFHPSPSPK